MEVIYANKKLYAQVAVEKDCKRCYGEPMAHKIHLRLNQLSAAPSLETMRHVGRCHELTGDRSGSFALNLTGSNRLIFRPANNKEEYLENRSIIWKKVTSVEITEIIDYH